MASAGSGRPGGGSGSGRGGGGGGGGGRGRSYDNNTNPGFRQRKLPFKNDRGGGGRGGGGGAVGGGGGHGHDQHGSDSRNCIVCYKEVKYYSVGPCNHSVCHECSGRMRVLLEQNECPICRQSIDTVVFTKDSKPFKELNDRLRMFIYLPKWGIYLEDEEVQRNFEALLEHRCPICKGDDKDGVGVVFPSFKELKTHLQRIHDLFACDLCAENIKLFTKERRFYTRQDLATHKRKGDRDDTSHRGHPLCQFCDRRYFDQDELYKHLRKDHYFCHFCDADGYNHYYNSYDDLRIHFRKEHFLCEEEHCKDEKFTSVFRSEIDFKAHLTQVHSRLLGKHGTKQARVIDLEFSYADEDRRGRRFNVDGVRTGGPGRRDRDRDHDRGGSGEGEDHREMGEDMSQPYFEPSIHPKPKVHSEADFPMLEGTLPSSNTQNGGGSAPVSSSSLANKLAFSTGKNVGSSTAAVAAAGPRWNATSRVDEEFPALGPSTDNCPPSSSGSVRPFGSSVISAKPPSSSGSSKLKPNGTAKHSSATEDFPSLGPSSASNGPWMSQTGGGRRPKNTPRRLKVASAPQTERKVEIDDNDSFHFVPLSVSRARKDSLTKKYEGLLNSDEEEEDEVTTTKGKKKNKNKSKSSAEPFAKAKAGAASLFQNKPSKPKAKPDSTVVATIMEDFPLLEPVLKSVPENPNFAGISVTGPPPGFSKEDKAETDFSNLFDMSFLSIAKSPRKSNHSNNNDEELELLKAKARASGKMYVQPPEFTHRSQRLLATVRRCLNMDETSFDMFKAVTNQYRKGELSSKEYYELSQDMFGVGDFRVIFPELLVLLPDIEKQQELLRAHRKTSGGTLKDITSCHECFQVLKSSDIGAHVKSHAGEELFPAL